MTSDSFVYWLNNSYGDCIYVGVTACLDRRWKEHQRRLGDEIAGVASAGPFTRQQALAIEKIEQRRLRPKYVGNLKKLPNRFSTYRPLPSFQSEPFTAEDDAATAEAIGRMLYDEAEPAMSGLTRTSARRLALPNTTVALP